MPAISPAFRQAVRQLSDKEKEALILKAARRDAELYDILSFELLEEVTLEEVRERSENVIHELLLNATGRSLTKAITKALRKAIKEIARAKRITKDAKTEVELHLYTLRLIFSNYTGQFDSYYKGFYTATARLLLRTIHLIRKNLHEDYHLEYKIELDEFLRQIHGRKHPLPVTLPEEFVTD
ncbi:hypothetical protein ACFSKU_00060 [Pontibacter silvestris]|uniref:Uncharacterized protein n=1 Tax=Pontibacter silvestris TaxID=2305183 RepID=A0ABW4WSC3_9BACT|nr:hypothetical protein [Pontibacter silvestris]MCC9138894.1 hypothetical protein [Pontibacter silvestris]